MKYVLEKLNEIFEKTSEDSILKVQNAIKQHSRIFVYGAGRSGLMMKAFAMRLMQAGYEVFVVGETVTPAIRKNDLLILASSSGETHSVIHFANIAKNIGASVLSLTGSKDSKLFALSNETVLFSAPNKNSSESCGIMGTLFEQTILLFCDAVIEASCDDIKKMRDMHANLE